MISIVLIRQPERKKLTHNSNHVNYFIPLSKPTWNWFRQSTRFGQHRGRVYQINILLLKQERGPKIWISKMMKIQYPNQKNHNSQTKNWFSHQNPHKSLVPPQLTHLILPLWSPGALCSGRMPSVQCTLGDQNVASEAPCVGGVSILQNDHGVQDMSVYEIYPHCRPRCRTS